jgi:hypothetical protein
VREWLWPYNWHCAISNWHSCAVGNEWACHSHLVSMGLPMYHPRGCGGRDISSVFQGSMLTLTSLFLLLRP